MKDTPLSSAAAYPSEYIAFRLGAQRFCIDIMSVREIRGWIPATPLPHAPDFLRGVINLRGVVLPVIDLGARLGLPISEPTARHAVIVVQLPGQIVGFLVDAVSDIIDVPAGAIQPTPDVASTMARDFLRGVIAADSGMISVLRIDRLAPNDLLETAA